MKKWLIMLAIPLWMAPVMALAQQDPTASIMRALEEKLLPDGDALQGTTEAASGYGVTYAYQASTDGWWTGLVIMNGSIPNNRITVALYDEKGDLAGQGFAYYGKSGSMVSRLLKDLITTGHVPPIGSVLITGANPFTTVMFVANEHGGFSMIEKISSFY